MKIVNNYLGDDLIVYKKFFYKITAVLSIVPIGFLYMGYELIFSFRAITKITIVDMQYSSLFLIVALVMAVMMVSIAKNLTKESKNQNENESLCLIISKQDLCKFQRNGGTIKSIQLFIKNFIGEEKV